MSRACQANLINRHPEFAEMDWTESDIQALKAQEAKDLAVEFLHKLETREKGPISPAEVQMKELEYELRLREAEIEDQRRRETHERSIKELELQIEQEKTRSAEAENRANQVRELHARLIERVEEASESLSRQLERASREHNLKVERLASIYASKEEDLTRHIQELEQGRGALREEIAVLTGIRVEAEEIGRLREEIDRRKKESRREHAEMEEQIATAEFEKTKRIGDAQRKQELELAQLDAQHQKDVLQRNQRAAELILEGLGLTAIEKEAWEETNQRLQTARERTDEEVHQIRDDAREALRREFNITRTEPVDVTELFYREQTSRAQAEHLRGQMEKMDAEIQRMRQHIEQEPQRIAKAVEAARTPVQNYIEQSGKR
jgi:hypothetical protein